MSDPVAVTPDRSDEEIEGFQPGVSETGPDNPPIDDLSGNRPFGWRNT